MAVSVQLPTSTSVVIQPTSVGVPVSITSSNNSSIAITQGGAAAAAIAIKKTGGTLTSLGDVVTTAVEDGYTLIYDSETNKWVSQSVTSAITSVDGGYY